MTGRRMLRSALMAGVALTAIAAAGCGTSGGGTSPGSGSQAASGSAAPAAGQHVTITGTNSLKFMPMTVHVHPGAVRITLRDMGAYPHNIVIPALKVTSQTVTGDPGGSSVSFTVTFPHAGSYPFHCQYHQSAGMTGMFVVSG